MILNILFFCFSLNTCIGIKQVSRGGNNNVSLEIPESNNLIEEQIISHIGYTVSYNNKTRLPNWVAYELTSIEVEGKVKRNNKYMKDPDAIGIQADAEDYRNSGWDRGHMAPSGDMKWDSLAMEESNYFTNICPQNHNFNNGIWRILEEKCRYVATKYGNVYIVCGPIIGNNNNGTIGYNQIIIPDQFYKVLLINDKKSYYGIGFLINNEAGGKNIFNYATSIDDIERITGIDFFNKLPSKIEKEVESHYDINIWK